MNPYLKEIPESVYHVTTTSNANKIIEFGFDLDLAGQGTIQRFRHSKRLIITDDFVIKRETMLEHSGINASRYPEKGLKCNNRCILKMTLKPDIKILDRKKFDMNTILSQPQRWSHIFAFAKENGCDGISNRDYFIIFRNRSITKIEKMEFVKAL